MAMNLEAGHFQWTLTSHLPHLARSRQMTHSCQSSFDFKFTRNRRKQMTQRIRFLAPMIAMLWCILLMPPTALGAAEPPTTPSSLYSANATSSLAAPLAARTTTAAIPAAPQTQDEGGFMASTDRAMGAVNGIIASVFFFDLIFWDNNQPDQISIPIVVLWLVFGAVFLTFRMGFINFRAFKHAVNVTRGRYSSPDDPGEVSHFGALTAALSATVGLGNIAGVAIAIATGGPGATFWMITAGLFGMTAKFTECTLGQRYREVRPDGRIMGGAMFYLSKGLAELKMPMLGKVLAVLFAILCIGGSFAGGNAFQVNQSMNAVQETIPFVRDFPWIYGLLMTFLVGIVIIGGIRRIAATAERIVPTMILVYVAASIWIIMLHITEVPAMLMMIVREAFSPQAAYGGFLGVLIIGFRRAAFSNEAGAGSAAIAHSAARTEYPVREGIVALLEPFIDTVVVCTMTALVIIISGAYNNPEYATLISGNQGAGLTSRAMGSHISWFPYVLSLAVFLFAYSTMISWSYYGERCWAYLFGDNASMSYRLLFLVFTFLGSIITATQVLEFGDLMILGMAFPNILGIVLLSSRVRADLNIYWQKFRAGEFKVYH
jgi:AGCS family alanine or glycine:cation symporter